MHELNDNLDFIRYGDEMNTARVINNYRFNNYFGVQLIYDGDFFFEDKMYHNPVCFFTDDSKPFSYGSPEGKVHSHLYVTFRGPRIAYYQQLGLLPYQCSAPPFAVTGLDELIAIMREIVALQGIPGDISHFQAVNLLERLLLILPKHRLDDELYSTQSPLLKAIRQLSADICSRPASGWNFARESSKLHISRVYFDKLFRQINHQPPHHYLLACRIALACKMLLDNPRAPIKAIAQECGFSDHFYFSRFFTQNKGLSPDAYRKMNL